MSILTDGNLLPFRIASDYEVLNYYALNQTGLNGQFVALVTGGQDPINTAGGYTTQAVAAQWANVWSTRYGTLRTVRPTQAGDTNANTLGITLHTTAIRDENGNLLANQPMDDTLERGFVQSGFAVPVLTRGVVTLKLSQILGTPIPGYWAVIGTGGNGSVEVVNPATPMSFVNTTGITTYSGLSIVGKWLSSSGAGFNGYATLKVQL